MCLHPRVGVGACLFILSFDPTVGKAADDHEELKPVICERGSGESIFLPHSMCSGHTRGADDRPRQGFDV